MNRWLFFTALLFTPRMFRGFSLLLLDIILEECIPRLLLWRAIVLRHALLPLPGCYPAPRPHVMCCRRRDIQLSSARYPPIFSSGDATLHVQHFIHHPPVQHYKLQGRRLLSYFLVFVLAHFADNRQDCFREMRVGNRLRMGSSFPST